MQYMMMHLAAIPNQHYDKIFPAMEGLMARAYLEHYQLELKKQATFFFSSWSQMLFEQTLYLYTHTNYNKYFWTIQQTF